MGEESGNERTHNADTLLLATTQHCCHCTTPPATRRHTRHFPHCSSRLAPRCFHRAQLPQAYIIPLPLCFTDSCSPLPTFPPHRQ